MEDIHTISKIKSNNYSGSKNDSKNMLGTFDSGYYKEAICSLLKPACEREVFSWLKASGLIEQNHICEDNIEICTKMIYKFLLRRENDVNQFSRSTEMNCMRDMVLFNDIDCNFKDAIRILHGWCKGSDINYMANSLGIKNYVVERLYSKVSNVAKRFMESYTADWRIGGPGVVVIIDTYPEGCTNRQRIGRPPGMPILCISQIKSIPQKYWLETLDSYDITDEEQVKKIKQEILRIIKKIVFPGSILVTPSFSTLCSNNDIQSLRPLYPMIVSIEELARHNSTEQSIYSNLETIWKSIFDICEVVQFYSCDHIQQYVISHMWSRRYGSGSLEMLLYQISLL